MTVQQEIRNLIATYLKAWNARDFGGMAALFCEPAIYVVPGGTISLPNRTALIAKLKDQFVALEAAGFDHTEIADVEVRQCNDTTAIANLKDVRRLHVDGTPLEVIDALYICILQDDFWRLSIAAACWTGWQKG